MFLWQGISVYTLRSMGSESNGQALIVAQQDYFRVSAIETADIKVSNSSCLERLSSGGDVSVFRRDSKLRLGRRPEEAIDNYPLAAVVDQ
jgi:hypothetical protein